MNRNIIVPLVLLVVALLGGVSWNFLPPQHNLHLQVEHEGAIASVNEGEAATIKFRATNKSSQQFLVDAVQSSCGCAKPSIDGQELTAGGIFPMRSSTLGEFLIHPKSVAGRKNYVLKVIGHVGGSVKPEMGELSVTVDVKAKTRVAPLEIMVAGAKPGQAQVRYIYLFDGGLGDGLHWPEPVPSNSKLIKGQYTTDERAISHLAPDAGYRAVRAYRLEYTPGPGSETEYSSLDFSPSPGPDEAKPIRVQIICQKVPPPVRLSPPKIFLPASIEGEEYNVDVLCVLRPDSEGTPRLVTIPEGVKVSMKQVSSSNYVCSVSVSKKSDCFLHGGEIILELDNPEPQKTHLTLVAGSRTP